MMSSLTSPRNSHRVCWWLTRPTAITRTATIISSSPATTSVTMQCPLKRSRSYHNSAISTATTVQNKANSSRTRSNASPPQYSTVRLNKYLVVHQHAQSRRDATMFIENGWVKVNGETMSKKDYDKLFWIPSPPSSSSSSSSATKSSLSSPLYPSQPPPIQNPIIELDPRATEFQQHHRSMTVLLNKPLGILSGKFGEPYIKQHPHPNAPQRQPYKPAIKLLTFENMFQPQPTNRGRNHQQEQSDGGYHQHLPERRLRYGSRNNSSPPLLEPYQLSKLAVAGRLDINTTGLLLLTQDGSLAAQIIGPQSEIEKEYLVRISIAPHQNRVVYDRDPAYEEVYDKIDVLRRGIQCGSDFLHAKSIDLLHSTNYSSSTHDYDDFQLRFVLTRGKKHHIRRMVEGVQYHVTALKRVRIGRIVLGSLPTGKWRYKLAHERL